MSHDMDFGHAVQCLTCLWMALLQVAGAALSCPAANPEAADTLMVRIEFLFKLQCSSPALGLVRPEGPFSPSCLPVCLCMWGPRSPSCLPVSVPPSALLNHLPHVTLHRYSHVALHCSLICHTRHLTCSSSQTFKLPLFVNWATSGCLQITLPRCPFLILACSLSVSLWPPPRFRCTSVMHSLMSVGAPPPPPPPAAAAAGA